MTWSETNTDEFSSAHEFNSFRTSHNRRIKSTELNSFELIVTIVRRMKRPTLSDLSKRVEFFPTSRSFQVQK